ncbi:MAG: tRNA (adenosine(37)-N6)-dimethylallyltransferase MiaA [Gammaproteobacteria bacterium]|nr:tRNA (adenosine(37)-N6)-dimethylallyltransferase MiaA [Gammaproteobacteria bacterium]
MSHPQVLCIMGPTASGKTDLALKLADELPCDLISVDSAMVYRGLDIGTAKPDRITLEKYPHALIDICDPTTPYSGAQFREDALRCIANALARQRLPVLVGGSMMYHHILQQGIAQLPSADPDTRHKLQVWANTAGIEALHDQLQDIDPLAAKRIHPNDQQRIFRALEIFFISGKRLSDYWQEQTLQNQHIHSSLLV